MHAFSHPTDLIEDRHFFLPETGFVRQRQLLRFIPFSKSTLWRRVKAGTFPAPVKLSDGVTAWRAEDVRRWIAEAGVAPPDDMRQADPTRRRSV